MAANQCLSCNVTEAQQTSVPAGVKQSQNNTNTDTAGGSNNPRIGRARKVKIGNLKKLYICMSDSIGPRTFFSVRGLLKLSNCSHLPVYVIVEGVVAAECNQGA